jgi:flagellar hook-length control protein FliK
MITPDLAAAGPSQATTRSAVRSSPGPKADPEKPFQSFLEPARDETAAPETADAATPESLDGEKQSRRDAGAPEAWTASAWSRDADAAQDQPPPSPGSVDSAVEAASSAEAGAVSSALAGDPKLIVNGLGVAVTAREAGGERSALNRSTSGGAAPVSETDATRSVAADAPDGRGSAIGSTGTLARAIAETAVRAPVTPPRPAASDAQQNSEPEVLHDVSAPEAGHGLEAPTAAEAAAAPHAVGKVMPGTAQTVAAPETVGAVGAQDGVTQRATRNETAAEAGRSRTTAAEAGPRGSTAVNASGAGAGSEPSTGAPVLAAQADVAVSGAAGTAATEEPAGTAPEAAARSAEGRTSAGVALAEVAGTGTAATLASTAPVASPAAATGLAREGEPAVAPMPSVGRSPATRNIAGPEAAPVSSVVEREAVAAVQVGSSDTQNAPGGEIAGSEAEASSADRPTVASAVVAAPGSSLAAMQRAAGPDVSRAEAAQESGDEDAPAGEADGPAGPGAAAASNAAPPVAASVGDARLRGVDGGQDAGFKSTDAGDWRLGALEASGRGGVLDRPQGGPAAPRDLSGQITLAVTQATQPEIEIRLDPAELGRVQIRLNPTEGGGLQALVMAERPETHDFLRRNADALMRDLNDAGYTQVSLEFATGGEQAPRRDAPEERRYARGFDSAPAFASAPEPRRRQAGDALDIRL